MSTLGRLAGALTEGRRFDPVTLEEFGALIGRARGHAKSVAGPDITDQRALGLSGWYSGVRYLCEGVSFLPAKTTREAPDGTRQRRQNPIWLDRPEKDWTRQQLLESWMLSILHRGVLVGFKMRNRAGVVQGMRFIHPDRVRFDVENNRKVFIVRTGRGSEEAKYTTRDIFSVLFMSIDGITPMSPITSHANTLGIVAAGDEYAGRFYSQGGHFDKYVQLTAPHKKEDVPAIKEMLREFHQGLENAHDMPVLSAAGDLKTIGLKAEDAQLIQSRQFGITEIARVLRIPPHKLYELSRSTFNNIEHQSIEAVMDSIRPWVERLEAGWNSDPDLVVAGNQTKLILEGLLRGDVKARGEWYQSAVTAGWMLLSEPRRFEDLPAVEGMDVYYRPAAAHTVDAVTGEVLIPAGRPTSQPTQET